MQYIELIVIASVMQFLFFAVMVGKARVASGIKAPAVSGDENFERVYRVQMNTLELLVAFIPALLIAGNYWPSVWVAELGGIYIFGRFVYWRAYVSAPKNRGLGFMLSFVPIVILILLAIVGIVMSLMTGNS